MAVLTLGTNANNSITKAIKFLPGIGSMVPADQATVDLAILDDLNPAHPLSGQFSSDGLLFIPNRGVLQVLPGDYIGVDSTGWPILVSANAIANGPWTHS